MNLAGRSILDIGTGTGKWAVDLADQDPSVTIVGLDLSPNQPEFVPPNVHFFVENVETEWSESESTRTFHNRSTAGSRADFRTCAEEAGFVDVSEEIFEAPLGNWPEDQQKKDIGEMLASSFKMGLHGLTAKAFQDVLGRSKEEVEVFNAFVRRELDRNTSKLTLHVSVFIARKIE
ncbi:hypothetical protein HIM_12423 [Hirsutella minnesotensis 3608]|uniref:Methyltransferase domain-containing protein n=1 Tax=Hirsutella minnesotensis 3608 TaxID=1043627 RepID=A0A0F8A046_9HYPO|nr:hypothetical protein HIM_12423 [Hirsutella minnesotensis 3608]